MVLMRYQPWHVVNHFHRQLDQILGDKKDAKDETNTSWAPSVDVHEETDKFVVRADLPGVEPSNIEITAENGVLTLRGERHFEKRDEQKGVARLERVEGAFLRRFTLPENVQTDNIRARHVNGVLEVTIPKAAAPEPKKVSVETH